MYLIQNHIFRYFYVVFFSEGLRYQFLSLTSSDKYLCFSRGGTHSVKGGSLCPNPSPSAEPVVASGPVGPTTFIVLRNDGSRRSLVLLLQLKQIYSEQLPNMAGGRRWMEPSSFLLFG